jgi:hypothetical protein
MARRGGGLTEVFLHEPQPILAARMQPSVETLDDQYFEFAKSCYFAVSDRQAVSGQDTRAQPLVFNGGSPATRFVYTRAMRRLALCLIFLPLAARAANLSLSPSGGGYLADGSAITTPIAALWLEWPASTAEFAGRLRVEASDDRRHWRTVVERAPVANLHAGGQLIAERRVEFPATRAKFWRLSWAGEAPAFPLTAVNAEPAAARSAGRKSELTVAGTPDAQTPGRFVFDLGRTVTVDHLNFALPRSNTVVQADVRARVSPDEAWQAVGRYGFYRLDTRNGEMSNGDIRIPPTAGRYWLAQFDPHSAGFDSASPQFKASWTMRQPPDRLPVERRATGPFHWRWVALGLAAIVLIVLGLRRLKRRERLRP